jgi:hypothetical protein
MLSGFFERDEAIDLVAINSVRLDWDRELVLNKARCLISRMPGTRVKKVVPVKMFHDCTGSNTGETKGVMRVVRVEFVNRDEGLIVNCMSAHSPALEAGCKQAVTGPHARVGRW